MYAYIDKVRYQNKVSGLCGNNNDNTEDDTQDLADGRVASTAQEYGHTWAIGECAELDLTPDINDPCMVTKNIQPAIHPAIAR